MLNNEKNTDQDKIINEVLKTEPEFILSDNFAEKLAKKVSHRFTWNQYFKEFLIYLGVLAGIGATLAIMAFIWYRANIDEWANFLLANISWVTGIGILVLFILFADRVVLRYFMFKSKIETV